MTLLTIFGSFTPSCNMKLSYVAELAVRYYHLSGERTSAAKATMTGIKYESNIFPRILRAFSIIHFPPTGC